MIPSRSVTENQRAVENTRFGTTLRQCPLLLLLVMLLSISACSRDPVKPVEGGCAPESSPYLPNSASIAGARITYCDGGDAAHATLSTPLFSARTASIHLMVAGYPDHVGIRSTILGVTSGRSFGITLPRAKESWVPTEISVPQTLQNEPVRVVLKDESSDFGAWAGLGFTAPPTLPGMLSGLLPMLLAILAVHLWCVTLASLLPGTFNRWARVFSCFLILGIAGFATFWAWFASPIIGVVASWTLLSAPFVSILVPKIRPALSTLLDANRTLLPAATLALFVLWIGLFPFSWQGESWGPAKRWSGLPIDNWLPFIFADMLSSGHFKSPMVGDWLSSDRPPLQTGIYLLFKPLTFSASHWYQGLSSWLQALVMIPLCSLMAACLPSRFNRTLALTVLALAPFTVLNTLFVWPKLLAATYCLIYHLLLHRRGEAPDIRTACFAGIAASLAILSHGGALFALIGSSLALVVMRPRMSFSELKYAAPTALVLYLPWILYQRFVDPPGDRLIKWHFAGQVGVTDLSLLTTLREAYASKPFTDWWSDRLANLDHIATGTLSFFRDVQSLIDAIGMSQNSYSAAWNSIYAKSFFHFSYALWWFGPAAMGAALLVITLRRRIVPWSVGPLTLAVTLALLCWALLMFSARSVVIHQGAYATVLGALTVGIVLVYSSAPRAFQCLAVLSVILSLAIYTFDPRSTPLSSYSSYVVGALLLLGTLAMAMDYSTSRSLSDNEEST